jgi:hypothetical protein
MVYAIPSDDGPLAAAHSGMDGKYSFSHLQPGTYRIIAFEEQHEMNLHDPKVLDKYTGHEGSVVITAGGKSVLDVNAVAESEVTP